MAEYLWQRADWPSFRWRDASLMCLLGEVRRRQGGLMAGAAQLGLHGQAEILGSEVTTTAAIEGVVLPPDSVRSSVARRLGLPVDGLPPAEREVDGLVEVLLDATINHGRPLDFARLHGWHGALFPSGCSGLRRIAVGRWRPESADPMQVISGPVGREVVHYEGPPARRVASEMEQYLSWWNSPPGELDGLLRAAIAHLWFLTIHPFEDGNGRLARAIGEMALAQDEGSGRRLYSLSSQILACRDDYYLVVERCQRGDGEVTPWLEWFLGCLARAMGRSADQMKLAMIKADFWTREERQTLNPRQRKAVNRLLDAGPGGFQGGMTNRKYRDLTKASPASAKRDLADLVARGILVMSSGRGRSVSYDLIWPT